MTRQELKALLADPTLLEPGHLPDLIALSEQYPYCGAFHRLILICLHRSSDLRYASELHKRILSIPDPEELFLTLRGETPEETQSEYQTVAEPSKGHSEDPFSLIDDFLEEHPEDTTEIESLLEHTEPDEAVNGKEDGGETAAEIVEAFLSQGPEAEIIRPEEERHREATEAHKETEMEGEYLTETLARIYIKQEKYASALRIFRSLNLKYPKKSGYFAEQIAYLEKVISIFEAVRPQQ